MDDIKNLRRIIDLYIDDVEYINECRLKAHRREMKFMLLEMEKFNLLRKKLADLDKNIVIPPEDLNSLEIDPFELDMMKKSKKKRKRNEDTNNSSGEPDCPATTPFDVQMG